MSGQTPLFLLIVSLIITAGGISIFYLNESRFSDNARASTDGGVAVAQIDEFQVINVVGQDVSGGGVNTLRMQVRYEGEGELPLDGMFIQIRTDDSIADLAYRNGTTERSVTNGYYTD